MKPASKLKELTTRIYNCRWPRREGPWRSRSCSAHQGARDGEDTGWPSLVPPACLNAWCLPGVPFSCCADLQATSGTGVTQQGLMCHQAATHFTHVGNLKQSLFAIICTFGLHLICNPLPEVLCCSRVQRCAAKARPRLHSSRALSTAQILQESVCLSVTCDPWRQRAALHQLGHLRPTGR